MNHTPPSPLCSAGHSQLLVVDIQAKLAVAMDADTRREVYRRAGSLAQGAGVLGIPVTVTEQYPQGIGHTAGEIQGMLPEAVRVLEKTTFSCCRDEGIMGAVKRAERPQVVVCGMESHVCVLQTALLLVEAGFQVFVVEDAVCSRDPRNKANALARMARAGVIITNFESVLFEWLADSRHPKFKEILNLIR
ncbi:hydrolase [Ectothiorhodospira shaposhnikovii]|uniref:hydrolase n=1 Tax=Ectothiorhodospira shaposhnikovii TaxID=1054 RepID=UPI001EE9A8D6|nr:hydrolase [Ectothiorhodospira shaposhnikovii]MCG5513389.1 hydrolase [Ectothiorhodospira shaposhnikovii]